MKEININIEGYNVNGICVGCLNYNRKMFYCEEVKEFFKVWANIDVPDGLSIQVCWECLAAVRSAFRFRAQILSAFDVLIDYSRQHTFLNSPSDLSKHATSRLSVTPQDVEPSFHPLKEEEPIHIDVDVIKIEEDVGKYSTIEIDCQSSEPQFIETTQSPKKEDGVSAFIDEIDFVEDITAHDQDASDDDIQLSKLKTKKKKGRKSKKEKKEKKQKDSVEHKEAEQALKKSRKLKNLPEDLVELYEMTEEEMWRMRAEDVARKEFVALKYKCNDCIIGFNTEKLMKYHMNGKHVPKSEANVQCDVCKAYFVTRDNVSAHRALHRAAYRCRGCGASTTLKHAMRMHACARDSAPAHACAICDREFSTKSKLTYHRGVCHQERPQCDCCGKVFANKMTLKYHLKILPQNKPKEKLNIPCKGCDKVFHSKKSYRAHVVIHNGLTYPCPICGKLFHWKRNLARHTRNHRERDAGALHQCRDCGKSFSSRDCYNNHMRLSKRHVSEDAHACNYCGKKFATKWCMVDHIDWDHLKLIKYQCNVCFKAFKTAKIMVAHIQNIHEGKKNKQLEEEHLCEICGKSYKTVKRLKGHVWAMHTNRSASKSFKCKLCPATFTWQTSIYKHMKMMHNAFKRTKQSRPLPTLKKPEPYQDIERMQYFQQNLPGSLAQNLAPPPPLTLG